jgi:hypothetical protein
MEERLPSAAIVKLIRHLKSLLRNKGIPLVIDTDATVFLNA